MTIFLPVCPLPAHSAQKALPQPSHLICLPITTPSCSKLAVRPADSSAILAHCSTAHLSCAIHLTPLPAGELKTRPAAMQSWVAGAGKWVLQNGWRQAGHVSGKRSTRKQPTAEQRAGAVDDMGFSASQLVITILNGTATNNLF